MSVELYKKILEQSPDELEELARFVNYITALGGSAPQIAEISRLPVAERAKHAAKFWIDTTGNNVIYRSKLLCLVGHRAGAAGSNELFRSLKQVLELKQVRSWASENFGDTSWSIGRIGALALFKDSEVEEAESRVRAYLRVMKPVKIRVKELAALVNVRYSRKFAEMVVHVIKSVPEYEQKIFRYRYGLNNGLVRRMRKDERRPRARVTNPTGRIGEVLYPHRFSLDPSLMVAPLQYLETEPALRDIMLEITDRRAKLSFGHRAHIGSPDEFGESGPLGSDKLEDRLTLMRAISTQATGYPSEFNEWWTEGVKAKPTAPDDTGLRRGPKPAKTEVRRTMKHGSLGGSKDWIAESHRVAQSTEPVEDLPVGVTRDAHGVLRDVNGAKITRGF